jgi:hypothetical protein
MSNDRRSYNLANSVSPRWDSVYLCALYAFVIELSVRHRVHKEAERVKEYYC